MRVLLVEDDSQLLLQLDTLLQDAGYSVDLADDGERAQYQLTEYNYDLAIVDIGLPKINGLDVIRWARQRGITSPIIVLTARERWQEKVEGLEAGADDYLTKPFLTRNYSHVAKHLSDVAQIRQTQPFRKALFNSIPILRKSLFRVPRLP